MGYPLLVTLMHQARTKFLSHYYQKGKNAGEKFDEKQKIELFKRQK